jgi:hypothetical protein
VTHPPEAENKRIRLCIDARSLGTGQQPRLVGPLGGGEKFLLIMAAESEQAIEARLADDPWTFLGLLRLAKVERWEILLNTRK